MDRLLDSKGGLLEKGSFYKSVVSEDCILVADLLAGGCVAVLQWKDGRRLYVDKISGALERVDPLEAKALTVDELVLRFD